MSNAESSVNIVIQKRDRDIIEFLRFQGFGTFEQLNGLFFKSKSKCSSRLNKLISSGFISSSSLKEIVLTNGSKFSKQMFCTQLSQKTKIYSLSSILLQQMSETRRINKHQMLEHQIILNDVLVQLKRKLEFQELVLNDPQLKTWSIIDAGRRREFTPDLSFESANTKLAVELERTLKSKNRYSERFGYYSSSVYSHVLYVYVNESHLPELLKYAGQSRKYAFSHYLNPTLVFSNVWGFMQLDSWIEKVLSVKLNKK